MAMKIPRLVVLMSTVVTVGGALAAAVVFGTIAGCQDDHVDDPVGGTGKVIYAVKDKKPFIVMDMFPELGRFKKLGTESREEYLMRRALATLDSKDMDRPDYQGKQECLVRMLLVKSSGEYDPNQWGAAVEIALFQVDRTAASGQLDKLAQLNGAALRKCFTSIQVHHQQVK